MKHSLPIHKAYDAKGNRMSNRKPTILIAVAAVVALGLMTFLSGCSQSSDSAPEAEGVSPGIAIEISAPGWDADTSTSCVLELTPMSDDSFTDNVAYTFDYCNVPLVVNCEEGQYKLKVVPPINADGSTYIIPDEMEVCSSNSAESAEPQIVNLELIPADEVAAEDIQNVLSAYENAVDNSDVSDVQKVEVLELAQKNAEASTAYKSAE